MSHPHHHHRPHRTHHQHQAHHQAHQPHQQRPTGRAAAGGFASATAAGAVPLEERLFGQSQVKRMAEEVFAALPESKLALLSLGFMAGGGVALALSERSHAARVTDVRKGAEASR